MGGLTYFFATMQEILGIKHGKILTVDVKPPDLRFDKDHSVTHLQNQEDEKSYWYWCFCVCLYKENIIVY